MEFLAFPDHPAAVSLGEDLLRDGSRKVIRHPSGRPWIVGRWSEADLTSAAAGPDRVVLLGRTGASEADLTAPLRAGLSMAGLDSLTRRLSGSCFLLASLGGRLRVQGDLAGVHQVFHGVAGGVTVAADRPQSIAALTGAGIAEEDIALALLFPGVPWPLSALCPWRGVESLPGGHWLRISGEGPSAAVRWWTPPEPEVPLSEGAGALRQALTDAVAARTAPGRTVSADLSGGMDSTSLCFLAARGPSPLITYHHLPLDPSNDDRTWAALCESELPGVTALTDTPDAVPTWYAGALEHGSDIEGPYPLIRTRGKLEHLAGTVSAHGSGRHLQGIGGDELFHARASCVHALVRSRPLRALRSARIVKSMNRWSTPRALNYLRNGTAYPDWMAAAARSLTSGAGSPMEGPDWEVAPSLPPWVTRDAFDLVEERLATAAARQPQPLAPTPVHHEMLRAVQVCGTMTRRATRVTQRYGVSYEAPFLDDRVIEATMAIRLEDRIAAGRYKPVLTTAMRGIVPDGVLGRRTKGDYSQELYTGLREHRSELLALCEDSRLARLGLIDGAALRGLITGLHVNTSPFAAFDMTLACESWLRAVAVGDTPVPAAPGRSEGGER
ncbi:asparagine synthase-related protein [Streptomyces xiamenensis]|uniref:asparagine synthase-related protein n=1 Tax=Streptomyces xiamenensis TaxID=408015 RepID=UPI003D71927F